MDYRSRIKKIQTKLKADGVASYLISGKENIYYLSGFWGSYGFILITQAKIFLLVDGRYYEHARKIACYDELILLEDAIKSLCDITQKSKLRNIAFDGNEISQGFYTSIKTALNNIDLMPLKTDYIKEMRLIKDPYELSIIREAAKRSKRIFASFVKHIFRGGLTEQKLALELEYMLKSSSEGISFAPIVLGGRNSSLPHGVPGRRKIAIKDAVLIDYGIKWKHYCTDHTRMLFTGNCFIEKYLPVVKKAMLKAYEHIRPGCPVKLADIAVRSFFEQKGLLKNFVHSTGHGIGLSVHEQPSVSFRSDMVFKEGMVVTIEPGIYFEGIGGVRFEEMVLVTKDGFEVL